MNNFNARKEKLWWRVNRFETRFWYGSRWICTIAFPAKFIWSIFFLLCFVLVLHADHRFVFLSDLNFMHKLAMNFQICLLIFFFALSSNFIKRLKNGVIFMQSLLIIWTKKKHLIYSSSTRPRSSNLNKSYLDTKCCMCVWLFSRTIRIKKRKHIIKCDKSEAQSEKKKKKKNKEKQQHIITYQN